MAAVELLISKSADVNARCDKGETTLQQSAYSGHVKLTKLLVNRGAEVNAQSDNGTTALHQAASNRQNDIVECLLQCDADFSLEDDDEATAYMIAKENSYDRTAGILREHGAQTPERKAGEFKQEMEVTLNFDPALAEATGLDPDTVSIEPHGYGCTASSWKLVGEMDGEARTFFLKSGSTASIFEGGSTTVLLSWVYC